MSNDDTQIDIATQKIRSVMEAMPPGLESDSLSEAIQTINHVAHVARTQRNTISKLLLLSEGRQWISVDERLPDGGLTTIVLTWDGDFYNLGSLDNDHESGVAAWVDEGDGHFFVPLYWMPLPEPPEGETT